MPILVSGGGTQLNSSTSVILSGLQQSGPRVSPSCNRRLASPSFDLQADHYAIIDNGNTQVIYIGPGVYAVDKIAGAVAYDAGAVSSVGITGDFVLRLASTTYAGDFFVGMNSDPLTDNNYASIDYAFYCFGANAYDIWESGAAVGVSGAIATNMWIWRTGTTLKYGIGATLAIAQVSPLRTTSSSATLYFDSSFQAVGSRAEVELYQVTTTSYSLTADVGVFAFTGQAAALEQGYALAATNGTFTYSGQAAGSIHAYIMASVNGTFAYNGQPAAVVATYFSAAGLGTFAYTGQAALLERGYLAPMTVGTFTYTGQANLLERSYLLAAGQATFTYSGQTAALTATYAMPAGLGTFSYSGQAGLLERGYSMPAALGTFAYLGQTALLLPGVAMPGAVGTFSYSGQAAAFAATLRMPGAYGSFSYTGQVARALLNLASFPPGGGGTSGVRVTAAFMR